MVTRDDMTSGDLAAGGALAPTQGVPGKKRKRRTVPVGVRAGRGAARRAMVDGVREMNEATYEEIGEAG